MADAATRSVDDSDGLDALMRFHDHVIERVETDEPDETLQQMAAAFSEALPADRTWIVVLDLAAKDLVAVGMHLAIVW